METTTQTTMGMMETGVQEPIGAIGAIGTEGTIGPEGTVGQETLEEPLGQGSSTRDRLEPGDRVRANTSEEINRQIDRETDIHIRAYAQMGGEEIARRINELEREWDLERFLETNASALALTGVFFGLLGSKKWLILSGAVLAFLFQHATQEWCPPVPLLRRMGIRTRKEIDQEKYALKALRGDFTLNESLPIAEAALQSAKA